MRGVWAIERGSSPHTRGALAAHLLHRRQAGIIPAYAGSTRGGWRPVGGRVDHPRIRGEHVNTGDRVCIVAGSSPHTRGAPLSTGTSSSGRRIIPAYAGSTTRTLMLRRGAADHPRIRGEHGSSSATTIWSTGSSPHTRGARCAQVDFAHVTRIIPAYAGSTPVDQKLRQGRPDHPRIRGEHAWSAPSSRVPSGSSPHTRGAPPHPRRRAVRDGIIPAYAGSTT